MITPDTPRAALSCDICRDTIKDKYIDGALKSGPWALMCPACHTKHGRGLGTGRGQEYTRRQENLFTKSAG